MTGRMVPCDVCQGTGQVRRHRYFRKLGHPAKGVLHLALDQPYPDSQAWRCGCGTSTRWRQHTHVEWVQHREGHRLCLYIRARLAAGAVLP